MMCLCARRLVSALRPPMTMLLGILRPPSFTGLTMDGTPPGDA